MIPLLTKTLQIKPKLGHIHMNCSSVSFGLLLPQLESNSENLVAIYAIKVEIKQNYENRLPFEEHQF